MGALKKKEKDETSRAKKVIEAIETPFRAFWQAVKRHRWKTAITSLLALIMVFVNYGYVVNEASKWAMGREIKEVLRDVPAQWWSGEPALPKSERDAILDVVAKYGQEITDGKNVASEYLLKLGNVYLSLGNMTEAEHYFDKGLERARAEKDEVNEAIAETNLAELQIRKGRRDNLDRALAYATKALSIHERKRMAIEQANDYALIGKVYAEKKDFPPAIKSFNEAFRLYDQERKRGRAADMTTAIGMVYADMGEMSTALSEFNEAKRMHGEARDRKGEAKDLFESGKIKRLRGDRNAALVDFQAARKIFAEERSQHDESNTLSLMGRVYHEIGDNDQALRSLQYAEDLKSTRERGTEAENLYYIGLVHNDKGSPDIGMEYMLMALKISKDNNKFELTARSLHHIGMALKKKGHFHRAIQYLEEARSVHNRNNDKVGEAEDLAEIGFLQRDMGKPREAHSNLERALKTFRQKGERAREARVLGYLGLLYMEEGDHFEARRTLWQAKRIYEECHDPRGKAEQLVRLALIYKADGELGHAQELIEIAQKEHADTPDELGQAHLHTALGLIYKDTGDFHKARRNFVQAHEVFQRETGDRKEEGTVKSELALINHQIGEWERPPLQDLRAALILHRRMGYKLGEARARGYLGKVLFAQKELDLAMEESEKALSLYRRSCQDKGMTEMFRQIGLILLEKRDAEQAAEKFKKALGIHRRTYDLRGEASALLYLGIALFKQDQVEVALEQWERGKRIGHNICCPKTEALHTACLGAALYQAEKFQDALNNLSKALAINREATSDSVAVDFISGIWGRHSSKEMTSDAREALCKLCEKRKDISYWTPEVAVRTCKPCEKQPGSDPNLGAKKTGGEETSRLAPARAQASVKAPGEGNGQ